MQSKDWPDALIESICDTIKERRMELGLSVYAVSQTSGVSQQAIAYYEKRVRRPSVECLAKISWGLDLRLSELVSRAERRLEESV